MTKRKSQPVCGRSTLSQAGGGDVLSEQVSVSGEIRCKTSAQQFTASPSSERLSEVRPSDPSRHRYVTRRHNDNDVDKRKVMTM